MTRSNCSPCFLLSVLGIILLASEWTPALETITLGQGGGLDWHAEGLAPLRVIDAVHRSPLDPNKLLPGNAPGNLIEFETVHSPNSIHLLQVEEGENIASGALDRGGYIDCLKCFTAGGGYWGQDSVLNLMLALQELLSEEEGGETEAFGRRTPNAFGIILVLDLGGRFWVDRIRLFPRNTIQRSPTTPFENNFLRAYELFTNDGTKLTRDGNPIWQPLVVEKANENSVIEVNMDPPRLVQHVRMRSITPIDWEIDEIEVFSKGFLTTGRYISDIFDAGEPAAWGNLRWSDEIIGDPLFSSLEIRTRTGDDLSPFVFTRVLRGKPDAEEIPYAVDSLTEEMDLAKYQKLPQTDSIGRDWEPGSVKDDLVNWSPFSSTYPASAANGPGIPMISPSPRQYFQFQVVFNSDALDAARVLNSLSFEFATPPLADSLKGEIFPREVEVSQTIPFTYAVQAVMQTAGLTGFDTIEMRTSTRVESIDAIELVDGDGQLIEKREDFAGLADRTLVDGFQIEEVLDDGFTVRFPRVRENNTRVQIRFRTEVLNYSTNFAASVRLSSEREAFQAVPSGNAAFLGEGDDPDFSGTTVLSPSVLKGNELLSKVELAPNPFTPNGDGINDQLSLRYNLLSLSAARPVKISVYDLNGRLVRVLHDASEGSGRYEDKTWDGRDDQGELLAPGLYIVRVSVDGDAADAEQSRVIALVY